ncbi:Suppressor of actin 1 [Giardia muris]|uniref:Suppressor of actin 1 n=1 Tax=Giardia muris TaxID=5742 RepID=A0A4Z1SQU4_GIAMU|nr:Suppressor of actin 1 [Giardia muris]|eukprot:TNJ28216.1 Suppressor of actin 1 [Giardia muris]
MSLNTTPVLYRREETVLIAYDSNHYILNADSCMLEPMADVDLDLYQQVTPFVSLLGVFFVGEQEYYILVRRGEAVLKHPTMDYEIFRPIDVFIYSPSRAPLKYVLRSLQYHFMHPGIYYSQSKRILDSVSSRRERDTFWWNRNVMVEGPAFTSYAIMGYVDATEAVCVGDKMTLKYCLISRRALASSGKRYFRRGIDAQGNTANFVETELILTMDAHNRQTYMTYLTTRGSIPLPFEQIPNLMQKPPISLTSSYVEADSKQVVFNMHHASYSRYDVDRVIYFNLLNSSGSENILASAFRELCIGHSNEKPRLNKSFTIQKGCKDLPSQTSTSEASEASKNINPETIEIESDAEPLLHKSAPNKSARTYSIALSRYSEDANNVIWVNDKLAYVHLDFHHSIMDSLSSDMEAVHAVLQFLHENALKPLLKFDPSTRSFSQSEIYRINCLDSLDRTTSLQLCLYKMVIAQAVATMDVHDISLEEIFGMLAYSFQKQGNVLSRQYATSNAMKGDLTTLGRRTMKGRFADLLTWVQRWYTCNFIDGKLQDGYLLLQNPVSLAPPPFSLPLPYCVLALFVGLICFSIIGAGTGSTVVICILLIVLLLLAAVFSLFCYYRPEYFIVWPRVRHQ